MNGFEILQAAVDTYGKEAQVFMAVEEMAELMQALSKDKRGKEATDNIAEEIADVEIMLEQLKMIFSCRQMVETYKTVKIKRLFDRLISEQVGSSEEEYCAAR